MPKKLDQEKKLELERALLPERFVGKFEWPIVVEYRGDKAKLRILKGRDRIVFDWYVPEDLRPYTDQSRYTRGVPDPAGRNPLGAQQWAREKLRSLVVAAENARDTGPKAARDREVVNDVPLFRVLQAFRESKKLAKIRRGNPQGADEIERWCDFYETVLGGGWRFYDMGTEVLEELHMAYQEPWTRTLPDGTEKVMNANRRAGHNTAAKVVRYLRTITDWAVAQPDGSGSYLLDSDPWMRIDDKDIPRELDVKSRSVGVAPEGYARAMHRRAQERGSLGQFGVLYDAEAATGRRTSEWREMVRGQLLTDIHDVRNAVEIQACRLVLPDEHIPTYDLDEAAEAYLAVSGTVVRFTAGKAVSQKPEFAAQHDRVIPLGPWIAGRLWRYIEEHWEPRGLPDDAPLFAAAEDPTVPTAKDLVQTWWERTERQVAKLDDVRIPPGRTHTLRRRFRTLLREHDDKSVAFYAGWTLSRAASQNRNYLPVHWQDVVRIAEAADKLAPPA